jgi:hypothetical protein
MRPVRRNLILTALLLLGSARPFVALTAPSPEGDAVATDHSLIYLDRPHRQNSLQVGHSSRARYPQIRR